MNGKVKVQVFGKAIDPKTHQNSLQLKKYFSLVRYLEGSDIKNKAELSFIDPDEPAMADYPSVLGAIKAGKPTPIVTIDGALKYYGDIPYESVYQDIKRKLAEK